MMKVEEVLLRLQPIITWGDAIECANEDEYMHFTGEDVVGFMGADKKYYLLYQDELALFFPYHLAKSLTL